MQKTLFQFAFFILLPASFCIAQSKNVLIDKIANYQMKQDPFYQAGIFPSQTTVFRKTKQVEDNSIFFTALINYTLQSVKETISENDQAVVDKIYTKSEPVFEYYENRNGDITYNFYQVRPVDIPYPNVKLYAKSKKHRLPDDLDVTSFMFLIQPTMDALNMQVKQMMESQSLDEKKVKSTFGRYRNSKAYRTWFAEKMRQDLDICVMSNVLLFVFEKELPLHSVDLQTITLIKQMIAENLHMNKPHLVSAYYQSTSIILYHLARLIAAANHPKLKELKGKIILDIKNELHSVKNEMERVILLTSLYRLNNPVPFELNMNTLENDMEDFFWFKANPFYGSRIWVKRWVGKSNFLHLQYKSEAYYWTLVWELQQLAKANLKTHNNQFQILSTSPSATN